MQEQAKPRIPKVFGIGLHRTGTQSLSLALEQLGYRSAHFPWQLFPDLNDRLLAEYDAFTDLPIPLYFRELDQRFPGSKFILAVRDVDAWLKSTQWLYGEGALVFEWSKKPFIPPIHKALYGTEHWDETVFRDRWERHLLEVRDYFRDRPEDLLEIDLTAQPEWEPLCDFLGREVPNSDFPHAHSAARLERQHRGRPGFVTRVVRRFGRALGDG